MKKALFCKVVIVMLFAVALVFCNVTFTEAATSKLEHVFKMGDEQPGDAVQGITDDVFANLVFEKTNGRIKIEVYHNGQLGVENEMIQQLQFGGLDFAQVSISPLAEFASDLNVLQLPYLYNNSEHQWKVLESEIGDHFLASTEKAGIKGLAWIDGGARSFYTKKKVTCAADIKGLKIRVQSSKLMMDMVKALGGVPQAIPYSDVYSALQTGVIDGAENNFPSYIDTSHYEVCKYFIVDAHTRVPDVIVCSTKTWEKLSAKDKTIIAECAKEAQNDHRKRWEIAEAKAKKKAIDMGCIITEPKDIKDFQKAVSGLYKSNEMQKYSEWIEKIRAMAK